MGSFKTGRDSEGIERRLAAHIAAHRELAKMPSRAEVARTTLECAMPYFNDLLRTDVPMPKIIFGDVNCFSYKEPDRISVSLGHSNDQVDVVLHETGHYIQQYMTKHGEYLTARDRDMMFAKNTVVGKRMDARKRKVLASMAMNEACAQFVSASTLAVGSGNMVFDTFGYLDERHSQWPHNDSFLTADRIYDMIKAERSGTVAKFGPMDLARVSEDRHQLGRGLAVLYYMGHLNIRDTAIGFLTTPRDQLISDVISDIVQDDGSIKSRIGEFYKDSHPFLGVIRK
ncbi:MAG TPA: hypothetical protein VL945_00130 [Candidatus Saccharimonadales bacterium]|nr:hypothetical protein [Candidatus Saccharimonadales bacterium]